MKLRVPHPQSLFLLTIVLVFFGLGLRFGYPIYRQQLAIREVRRLGGSVLVRLKWPEWLRDRLPDAGHQVLGRVRDVNLGTSEVTDADLALLREFPTVERLALCRSRVTDAGLLQLSGLDQLDTLMLDRTDVTVAGLENLRRLPHLSHVTAVGSGVTYDAKKRFDATNPQFSVYIGKFWDMEMLDTGSQ